MFTNFINACIELGQVECLFFRRSIVSIAVTNRDQGEWTSLRILAALKGEEMPIDNF